MGAAKNVETIVAVNFCGLTHCMMLAVHAMHISFVIQLQVVQKKAKINPCEIINNNCNQNIIWKLV